MAILVFALQKSWGEQLIAHNKDCLKLAQYEEREFEDGEHKMRPLESVRQQHVFLMQALYSDSKHSVNDKLCRLLFFIGTLKDAGACEVTVILPYFAYARKDRKTKSRDPITTKYMAQLIEAVGASRVITMDVHNAAAYQNSFRIPTEHLEARTLFVPYISTQLNDESVTVVSQMLAASNALNYFVKN